MANVAGLERQVAGALIRAGYSGNDSALVVAVSGGPDSAALLHCLYRLREGHQLRLHVAHLNHDFRGEEALEDARFVAELARDLGLEATVEERDVVAYQRQRRISSFEQAAREFRYSFLAEVAGKVGAAAVAVGHTSDDLAETVLLHILRGTGTRGLRGMSELSAWPWPRDGHGLRLFRPLLQATKVDTVGYCRKMGKDYREDSGNYLPQFTRNRVRISLLPLLASEYNPRVRESLVRLSKTVSLELDYLDGETARLWEQLAVEAGGGVGFHQPAVASLHPALLKLLLRRAYTHLMGDARRLSERHLDAMAELARASVAARSLDLPGGLKFHRSYDYLRLSREADVPCPFPRLEGLHALALPKAGEHRAAATAGPWRITMRVDSSLQPSFEARSSPAPAVDTPSARRSWTAYLDRASLGEQAQIRTRKNGDRFQPLGLAGEKKLQDFFTDARVPRGWRDRVPLLVTQRGIAWVIGYRIAHWTRVGEVNGQGAEILEITFVSDM